MFELKDPTGYVEDAPTERDEDYWEYRVVITTSDGGYFVHSIHDTKGDAELIRTDITAMVAKPRPAVIEGSNPDGWWTIFSTHIIAVGVVPKRRTVSRGR